MSQTQTTKDAAVRIRKLVSSLFSGKTALLAGVVLAFGLGMFVQWSLSPATPSSSQSSASSTDAQEHNHADSKAAESPQVYTCSMHPSVRLTDPNERCPNCDMPLVPVEAEGTSGPMTSTFSPSAKALLRVETAPVRRAFLTHTIRMVGEVVYDETRLKYITAWMPGRLDRLFVDYEGMPIQKGFHMVEIYSPELITAQEEFLQARQMVRELRKDDSSLIRNTAKTTFTAATDKLLLLGLKQKQIDTLAKTGTSSDRITIYAPVSGVVTQRMAKEGQYVKTGDRIYAIADLTQVWIQLEAYESDLAWLHYGQKVQFTTRAYPGRTFQGRVSFISPIMNEKTRTIAVRVNAPNPNEMLKPGMFVQAEVTNTLDADGNVIAPSLAGKLICPMHPEIIKDKPSPCDICGMDLVPAASLGYTQSPGDKTRAPLTIPASAVLRTGKRAVVYVEKPDADQPTYELHQITLGPRAEDQYVVTKGLQEGQRVVTQGAFRIDSERQLQGLPSMMSPPKQDHTDHVGMTHLAEAETSKSSTRPDRPAVVNISCPIMGSKIDPKNVPDNLYREYKGQGVGFCCGGCPEAWDKLSDAQKETKLRAVMKSKQGGQ